MQLKTLKGSIIKRYSYGVGKQIGGKLYLHIDYAKQIMGKDLDNALHKCPKDFKPRCVAVSSNWIRFDEAPDFDTAREPHAGTSYKVYDDGKVERRVINEIWHHKWLWVKDDYNGFDVQKSFNWSKEWLSKLDEPASGSKHIWEQQLKRVGLK